MRVTGPTRLWLAFSDGFSGEVDIPLAAGDPLIPVFDQAICNGLTVEWPGGIDYCPDTLRLWCEATFVKEARLADRFLPPCVS